MRIPAGLVSFLNPRYKLAIHIVQLVLVHIAIGLSVPRLFMKNQPTTRANTIALGMGAKSLIVIFYQLLTEHTAYFSRWASHKANTILNSLEILFWGAVAFLVLQANLQVCNGVVCGLSWGVVVVAILNSIISIWTAGTCYLEFRRSRQNTALRSTDSTGSAEAQEFQRLRTSTNKA